MQITSKQWVVAGAGFVIAVAAFFAWSYRAQAPAPDTLQTDTASSTETALPSESAAQSAEPSVAFAVNPSDTVTSWNFQGAYTGNAELTAKAKSEIARLTGLLGSGEYPDYILYVSIANQYDLLGDGANEFLYLKKALALDATKTGLAWYNIGQLFARLGAYATARTALERAVAAEPFPQYERALADFLKEHYPGSVSASGQ